MTAVNTLYRACCIIVLLPLSSACQDRGGSDMTPTKPQTFTDAAQAVAQAKSDLASLLRDQKDLNLGVDLASVEASQAGRPVRRVEIDFDKLLVSDAVTEFGSLVKSERDTVVPLVAQGKVATVVEVAGEGQQWRIVGLGGKDIADDLNAVRAASAGAEDITLYEVPNLQARVYGVRAGETEQLFTNYGGRLSIQQAVDAATLIPMLRADAIEFQKTYGDAVKEKKLVR